jgi:hypothetical protein
MAAGEHGDGPALDAGAVRGLVDAAGEAGDDDEAGFAKLAGELTGNFKPAPEALREPTIAIIGRISVALSPRTASSGGASSSVASRAG